MKALAAPAAGVASFRASRRRGTLCRRRKRSGWIGAVLLSVPSIGIQSGNKATHIVLGQEVKRTEELVVVKLKALCRLKPLQVLRVRWWLWHLLRAALGLVLSMRILRGDSRTPPAATVVAVGAVRSMRRDGRVVWHPVVVV